MQWTLWILTEKQKKKQNLHSPDMNFIIVTTYKENVNVQKEKKIFYLMCRD